MAGTTVTLATDHRRASRFPEGASVTVALGRRPTAARPSPLPIALDPARDRGGHPGAHRDGGQRRRLHHLGGRGAHARASTPTRSARPRPPRTWRPSPRPGAARAPAPTASGRGSRSRPATTPGRAPTAAAVSDTQLVSPALQGGRRRARFQVAFDHAYSFEASARPPSGTAGVIELSTDDGATWRDVSTLVDPGYTGTLARRRATPWAGGRPTAAATAAFPALDRVTLDFGTALAGQTVRLRFRIGTDGWRSRRPAGPSTTSPSRGSTNHPFTAVRSPPHAGPCAPPTAAEPPNPGRPQTAVPNPPRLRKSRRRGLPLSHRGEWQ